MHVCKLEKIINMADSDSSSESPTSGSHYSNLEGLTAGEHTEEVFQAFTGIQPWCFEPPGQSGETQESEENIEPPRRRCDRDS